MENDIRREHVPLRCDIDAQPPGCHAPLHAGHPVITPRQVEAKASQTGRSVITGSSAYADDDDGECSWPLSSTAHRAAWMRVFSMASEMSRPRTIAFSSSSLPTTRSR